VSPEMAVELTARPPRTLPDGTPGAFNARFCAGVEAELEARGWSARELSRRSGLAHNALTFLRAGRWISLEHAARIARALEVPIDDLIGGGDGSARVTVGALAGGPEVSRG
jgi:transcriptional regulator with XRE-family HTH domain